MWVQLRSRSAEVRMWALEALARIPNAAPTHFRKALSDSDELVRIEAAASIGRRGDGGAIRALRRALSDKSPLVRSYVAAAMGAVGTARDRSVLEQRLTSESSDAARLGFFVGLWLLQDADAVDAAIELLGSPDYRVRCATATELGTTFVTGRTRVQIVRALRGALAREQTVAAKDAIQSALKKMSPSVVSSRRSR